ncbi:MAG: hypothetical protein AAGA03_19595, partial [Planctomycetota bacterium]
TDRVQSFLTAANLQGDAAAGWSPLFWTDALWIYQACLVLGIVFATLAAVGVAQVPATWLLWLLVVAWANRFVFLAGIGETLLSLSLFAVAIAPGGGPPWRRSKSYRDDRTGIAARLLGLQTTLVAGVCWLGTVSGEAWWNGMGAYAMFAPVEDRLFDWTESWLATTWVYELLTVVITISLPLGLCMTWSGWRIWGRTSIAVWAVLVALLGAHWMLASLIVVGCWAIDEPGPGTRADTE